MPKLQKWNISSTCPAPLGKLSSWVIARVTGCLARGATYLRLASGTPWVIGQHCPCHDITGTGHEIFYVPKFGSIDPFWQRICGLEAYHPVENRIALCISYCPSIKQLLIWGRPNHQKNIKLRRFPLWHPPQVIICQSHNFLFSRKEVGSQTELQSFDGEILALLWWGLLWLAKYHLSEKVGSCRANLPKKEDGLLPC